MAKAGAIDVPDAPVDLTEELPLDDENVLATGGVVGLAPLSLADRRVWWSSSSVRPSASPSG